MVAARADFRWLFCFPPFLSSALPSGYKNYLLERLAEGASNTKSVGRSWVVPPTLAPARQILPEKRMHFHCSLLFSYFRMRGDFCGWLAVSLVN